MRCPCCGKELCRCVYCGKLYQPNWQRNGRCNECNEKESWNKAYTMDMCKQSEDENVVQNEKRI